MLTAVYLLFTNILKIIVFLFCSIKISRIFVKEITTKTIEIMLDLNTITKEQFAEELLMSDDCNDFYLPREQKILSLDFDFEEMKQEFENWLVDNCDNF